MTLKSGESDPLICYQAVTSKGYIHFRSLDESGGHKKRKKISSRVEQKNSPCPRLGLTRAALRTPPNRSTMRIGCCDDNLIFHLLNQLGNLPTFSWQTKKKQKKKKTAELSSAPLLLRQSRLIAPRLET
jgi:hypothetical protein